MSRCVINFDVVDFSERCSEEVISVYFYHSLPARFIVVEKVQCMCAIS